MRSYLGATPRARYPACMQWYQWLNARRPLSTSHAAARRAAAPEHSQHFSQAPAARCCPPWLITRGFPSWLRRAGQLFPVR